MLYAPIDTLLEMRKEAFKDGRRPVDDAAVARLTGMLLDEAPDPIWMALVRLREGLSRLARRGRPGGRRAAVCGTD